MGRLGAGLCLHLNLKFSNVSLFPKILRLCFFFVFFFLCGQISPHPPSGENAMGLSFKNKKYIFVKSWKLKTQIIDIETVGNNTLVQSRYPWFKLLQLHRLVIRSLIQNLQRDWLIKIAWVSGKNRRGCR